MAILEAHTLRFHKIGQDGSAKCNAFHTGNPDDHVLGALFEISPSEKDHLDRVEGLNFGYDEKTVIVGEFSGAEIEAVTYYATSLDDSLKPFCWYKNHVLVGAEETCLPAWYIKKIDEIECMEDPDSERDTQQRAIYG